MSLLVQMAPGQKGVRVVFDLNGVGDEIVRIVDLARLDQHHFEAHRVEELLETVRLVKVGENVDVAVGDMGV